jgi:hypothetical protein
MNNLPPSGAWAGYYLYAHSGLKYRMRLNLTFAIDGSIHGEGVDDIARFVIEGRFDGVMSVARWTKAYVGMHIVEYSGIYCQRAICGDWTLGRATGGFWIWLDHLENSAEEQSELGEPLEVFQSTTMTHRPVLKTNAAGTCLYKYADMN